MGSRRRNYLTQKEIMQSKLADNYKSIHAQLVGLDPIDDRSTIKQLIASKSEVLKAWRAACDSTYTYKAQLQQAQLELNQADMTREQVEGAKVDIALLKRAAKGEKIMPETRDQVLAEIRKGGK